MKKLLFIILLITTGCFHKVSSINAPTNQRVEQPVNLGASVEDGSRTIIQDQIDQIDFSTRRIDFINPEFRFNDREMIFELEFESSKIEKGENGYVIIPNDKGTVTIGASEYKTCIEQGGTRVDCLGLVKTRLLEEAENYKIRLREYYESFKTKDIINVQNEDIVIIEDELN